VFAFARQLRGTTGDDIATASAFDGFRARWREGLETASAALADAQDRERRARESAQRVARHVGYGLAVAEAWRPQPLHRPMPRLYWRPLDGAYSEDCSRLATAEGDGDFLVSVDRAGARLDRLRIDPDDLAGVFEISAVDVGGMPVTSLIDAVIASNGVVLETQGGVMLAATADDPWVEIGVVGVCEAADALPVRFRVRARGLPELLWQFVERDAHGAERLRDLGHRMASLAAEQQDRMASLAAEQQDRMASLAAEQQDRMAMFAAEQEARCAERFNDLGNRLTTLSSERSVDAAARQTEAAFVRDALDRLGSQFEEVLGWTRRRTFRYWWHRFRAGRKLPEGTS
jgi:hypothetical protein